MSAPISNVRPKPDRVLTDIADYVTTFKITSKEALATAQGNLNDAAKGLGISTATLQRKIKKLGLTVPTNGERGV